MPLNFTGIMISYLDLLPSVPVHFSISTTLTPERIVVSWQPSAARATVGTATVNAAINAAEERATRPLVSFRFFMSLLVSHS